MGDFVTKRIVLIEDDTDLYALLKYNLEKEGFAISGSQTGRGALDLCRRTRPDLVLLVFIREQLLNAVWGQDRAITDRTVDVYILRLRQKIERDPAAPRLIHSVRGFGYSFEPKIAEAAREEAVLEAASSP